VLVKGKLYTNDQGDIFLFEGWKWLDFHLRNEDKVYTFKVIVSKTIKQPTVALAGSYLGYLNTLPKNHPAWILYGKS